LDNYNSVIIIRLWVQQEYMLLPSQCSAKVEGEACPLSPSYIISVKTHEGEYMLAVVCDEHKGALETRLVSMQETNKIPEGSIHFQAIKGVVTNCVKGIADDYIELNEKRRQ
jgi:hypothetical protein